MLSFSFKVYFYLGHSFLCFFLSYQIFNLMKYDSYSRFLKSDIFLNHKKSEEQEENSPEAQTAAKRASRIYNTWYDESH